jgi:hypothetical protein
MKEQVLEIVKAALSNTQDNLHRAEAHYKNRTAKGMLLEHGNSGRTCADVLGGYQDREAELERCVKWVETAD